MSINWMMKKPGAEGAVPQELPGEAFLYRAGSISIALSSTDGGLNLKCDSLKLWLSYERMVLSTDQPATYKVVQGRGGVGGDARFENLIVPLSKILEVDLYQPWFGPNAVKCVFRPVANGNLPADSTYLLYVTFNNGGTYEFYNSLMSARLGESLPRYQGD